MDTLNRSPSLIPSAADDRFLPPESGLSMEPRRLNRPAERKRAPLESTLPLRRLFIFVGTALLAIAGGYEMYGVVKVGGVTFLEAVLLAFFLVLLAWVAFSFMSALIGFFVLLTRRQGGLAIDREGRLSELSSHTAMLLPTYNEDPHHVMARLRAMYESVAATGHEAQFDWFLLSDTTDPEIWVREEVAFMAFLRACGTQRLYYRHRSDNTARKSGNIAEWVRLDGSAQHTIK
jgi:membrane glycosyltransferase